MNKCVDTKLLKKEIKEKYGNIDTFSKEVGCTYAIMYRKLDNKTKIYADEIKLYSELLKIPIQNLFKR